MNVTMKSKYELEEYIPKYIKVNSEGHLESILSEIGGLYTVELKVSGVVEGTVNIKTKKFYSDEFATKLDITTAGSYIIDITEEDNYIVISSDDTFTDLVIDVLLKKKIDNTIITDIADIPTSDIGCIIVLTPELEAQGGASMVDMCWSNTLNKYVLANKTLLCKLDASVDNTGNENTWITSDTFYMFTKLMNRGITIVGLLSFDGVTSGTKGFRLRSLAGGNLASKVGYSKTNVNLSINTTIPIDSTRLVYYNTSFSDESNTLVVSPVIQNDSAEILTALDFISSVTDVCKLNGLELWI